MFPYRVSFTSSPDTLIVRPCVTQNSNRVDNLNTSLECNRFCVNLSSLCVRTCVCVCVRTCVCARVCICVWLAFLCHIEMHFCTGASPTHEFSSVLTPFVGCCYQIHTYMHIPQPRLGWIRCCMY